MRWVPISSPSLSSLTSYWPSTSVVAGTRSSSSPSNDTIHSSSSRSTPVIDSTVRPIRSCTCSTAPSAISRVDGPESRDRDEDELLFDLPDFDPDELLFDLPDLDSAIFDFLHLGPQQFLFFELPLPGDSRAPEQLLPPGRAFLGADGALLVVDFELHQLAFDVVLVVELPVRLLGDL